MKNCSICSSEKYCVTIEGDKYSIQIKYNKMYILDDEGKLDKFKINNCPICGRDLNV